jgi:hypothetical protein
MKESRDREVNGTLSASEIDQLVALCAAQNVTHITVDTHWEYSGVMQQWITSIRAHGKRVYFRGRPNQWENDNGTTGIMSPAGYNLAIQSLITNNPSFFQSGDIFDPCSEPETGLYWTNRYGNPINWNSNPTATADYNSFLLSSTAAANAALGQIGVSGVDTTIHSMNGWMADNVLSQASLTALGNRVCIDTYPEGTSTDPVACAILRSNDLQAAHSKWPAAVVLVGEMGYANSMNVSDTAQSNVLAAELTTMQGLPYLGGVNYWVGPGSTTAGGYTYVMQKTNGVWLPRPACLALSNYFGQVLVPGRPQALSAALSAPGQSSLCWANNPEPNVTGYNVYRSTTPGFTPAPANRLAANWTSRSYNDTGLAPSTAYYYLVTAVSAAGLESAPSSQASVAFTNLIVTLQPAGSNLQVSWPQGALLEAPAPTGPWTTNPAGAPFLVSPTNSQRFYRAQARYGVAPLNPIAINFSGSGTAMGGAEIAGVLSQSNWNNAAGPAGIALPLTDSTGTPSGASVTWNDPKSVTSTGIADIPGNFRMMKNYLDASDTTTTTVLLSGLPSNPAGYRVYAYCDGNNSETREGAYTISGPGFSNLTVNAFDNAGTDFSGAFAQAGNYLLFTVPNVSAFTLSATAVTNGASFPRAALNGIQIAPQ